MTAALNASLGTHIQSPVAASTVLFAVGLVLTAAADEVLRLLGHNRPPAR